MVHVRQRLGVSERRACRALAQPRSTQRRQKHRRNDEEALRSEIVRLARQFGRYGYRRFLRAFEERAQEMGTEPWVDFIAANVARGRMVPIRLIENHVRAYARRMVNDLPDLENADQIPFDEEVFVFTRSELAEHRPPEAA